MRSPSRLLGITVLMTVFVAATVAATALHRQWPAALAGFAARTVCGGVFIAGRPIDEVVQQDLQSLSVAMRLIEISADPDTQRVTATLPIAGSRHALYRPERGCTLLPPQEVPEVAVLAGSTRPQREDLLGGAAAALRSERLQPLEVPWPLGAGALPPAQWPDGVNADALNAAIGLAFASGSASSVRPGTESGKSKGTRAVLVALDGQLIAERYAPGFDARTPQLGWSLAKTVFGALAWARFQSQATDLRTPVVDLVSRVPRPRWVGEWKRDGRRAISLDHLFTMFDGLDHSADDAWLMSELPRLLWVVDDAGRFAGQRGLAHAPGEHWRYSSAVTNLLSRVLRDQFASDEDYLAYAGKTLFAPIGALSALFETDGAGNLLGSSYLWASPHDWLRMGQLLLQDGRWGDRTIFPGGWLEYATAYRVEADGRRSPYGAQAWLTGESSALRCGAGEQLPEDGLVATGVWGQILAIFPKRQIVILRLGWSAPAEPAAPCTFLAGVLGALP